MSQIALISLPHLCTSPSSSVLTLHQPPIHPPKPLCTQQCTSLDSCTLSPTWQSHPCTFSPSLAALTPHLPHCVHSKPNNTYATPPQPLIYLLPFGNSHPKSCCTHTSLFLSFNVLLSHIIGHPGTLFHQKAAPSYTLKLCCACACFP